VAVEASDHQARRRGHRHRRKLASQAAANGVTFVDTYPATIGHDACTSASVKDVEGLIPTSPAYPFHPNQRGQQVMAGQVLAALGR
jgi:lysophospholipase L1-like esterase